jgi:hypothetical protein
VNHKHVYVAVDARLTFLLLLSIAELDFEWSGVEIIVSCPDPYIITQPNFVIDFEEGLYEGFSQTDEVADLHQIKSSTYLCCAQLRADITFSIVSKLSVANPPSTSSRAKRASCVLAIVAMKFCSGWVGRKGFSGRREYAGDGASQRAGRGWTDDETNSADPDRGFTKREGIRGCWFKY